MPVRKGVEEDLWSYAHRTGRPERRRPVRDTTDTKSAGQASRGQEPSHGPIRKTRARLR